MTPLPESELQATAQEWLKEAERLKCAYRQAIRLEMETQADRTLNPYDDDIFTQWEAASHAERAADEALLAHLAARPQEQEAKDAANWRALIGCARIRPLGSAGLDVDSAHDADYGHLGIDLWTKHGPWKEIEAEREIAVRWLSRFIEKAKRVDAALAAQAAQPKDAA